MIETYLKYKNALPQLVELFNALEQALQEIQRLKEEAEDAPPDDPPED